MAKDMRRKTSLWEDAYHLVMLLLLMGAFLPLWGRVSEATVDPAEGDPFLRLVLLLGYSVAIGSFFLRVYPMYHHFLEFVKKTYLVWLLLLWAGLSFLWSDDPSLTLRRWVAALLTTLYAVVLAVRYDYARWLLLLSSALGIALLASLISSVFFPDLGVMFDERGIYAWRGIFVHKNILGVVAALSFLTFLIFSERGDPFFKRILILVGLGMAAYLLYRTDSKASLAVLLGSLLALIVAYVGYKQHRIRLAYFGFVLIFLAFASGIALQQAEQMFLLLGRDVTLTGRTLLWEEVWYYIQERMYTGYGLGVFWALPQYGGTIAATEGWFASHSHNGYMDVWLDLGLPGLLLASGMLFLSWFRWWRAYLATGSVEALFWLQNLSFVFTYNFVESAFLKGNSFVWVLLVMAYLASSYFKFSKALGEAS